VVLATVAWVWPIWWQGSVPLQPVLLLVCPTGPLPSAVSHIPLLAALIAACCWKHARAGVRRTANPLFAALDAGRDLSAGNANRDRTCGQPGGRRNRPAMKGLAISFSRWLRTKLCPRLRLQLQRGPLLRL